ARPEIDLRADATAVARAAGELHAHRRRAAGALVAPDVHTAGRARRYDVDAAIAIHVGRDERASRRRTRAGFTSAGERAGRHIHPAAGDLAEQARSTGGPRQEVQQTVVVVVDELCRDGVSGRRRCRRDLESLVTVAQRENAWRAGAAEEEIRKVVFVDIRCRDARQPALDAQTDVRGP